MLKGILLEWDHPAQDDRVFETELDVSRHPENEDQLYITKMLVVDGVQVEDSGIYTCKVRVFKDKRSITKLLQRRQKVASVQGKFARASS